MTGDAERETAAAVTRWNQWESRYAQSSRHRALHARVATALIFTAIVANLVFQLLVRHV